MFEVHLTTNPIAKSEMQNFELFCQSIDVKPILIELPQGDFAQQPMISKAFSGLESGELIPKIFSLKTKFSSNNYEIVRTKVEVPLNYINQGLKEFPQYKGQYYEWHGKVEFEDIEKLKSTIEHIDVHLSKNALKDQSNRRFLTIRWTGRQRIFLSRVDHLKKVLQQKNIILVKDEYEFCVYDSNKLVDSGWIETPEITDMNYLNLLAFEGFLRRLVDKKEKFILKGSLLTRQYLNNKNIRSAMDLDFIYGEYIDDDIQARETFTKWVTSVTETSANDLVEFRSFGENEFWRRIDYAMNDDFPTTNTDLYCHVENIEVPILGLDISWNLPLEEDLVPLVYEALEGDRFTIPYSVPIATQIAWKLHQSIVRPRAKDLIDILLLLESNDIDDKTLNTIASVFINECLKDQIDPLRIINYSTGKVSAFLKSKKSRLHQAYHDYWNLKTPFGFEINSEMKLIYLDDVFRLEKEFKDVHELTNEFEMSLKNSGISDKIVSIYKSKNKDSIGPALASSPAQHKGLLSKMFNFIAGRKNE